MAAFAELRELGVRTIIHVDGDTPDASAAERHGLRYVHLPHGYEGVPKARVAELARRRSATGRGRFTLTAATESIVARLTPGSLASRPGRLTQRAVSTCLI